MRNIEKKDSKNFPNYFLLYSIPILIFGTAFALSLIPRPVASQVQTTTISSRINSSTDDAEERVSSGIVTLTSTDLELGAEGGGSALQLIGLRFDQVEIPPGYEIVNASIEFEVDEADTEATFLTMWGELSLNPVTFSDQNYDVSSRPKTNAYTTWNDVPTWDVIGEKKSSPDLSLMLNEVITQPGWLSGNAIVIIIEGTGERTAKSYDGKFFSAPLLTLEIVPDGSVPTPTATITPTPFPVGTIRIAVIGDYGMGNSEEAQVALLVDSWNPDHIITLGDNNYPDGEAATIDFNIGQFFSSYIGNYQGAYGSGGVTNRFWPALGNHDWHTMACTDGVCSGAYFDYFTLPGNERYYDVDLGLVHLFAINSESPEPDGNNASSVQAVWLQSQLAASTACYDLVYMHHAPYSSGRHGSDSTMQWPYANWGADAVLAAHDHLYERIEANGIPYFVNGAGGASLYDFDNLGNLPPTVTSWVRYNSNHGAMLITADPTKITYEFYNIQEELIDSYSEISNCNPGPTATPGPSTTPSLSPSPTLSPTPSPSATNGPSMTPTSTPSSTPLPTATSTPTPTLTPLATASSTPTLDPNQTITVTSRVSDSHDDAEEHLGSGSVALTSTDLELGAEGGGGGLQRVGMRFTNLAIPAGATITNAYLEFEVDEVDDEVTNLIIFGESAVNPAPFSDQMNDLTNRPITSSSVPWNNIPNWTEVNNKEQSPNIADILQEIVNLPEWTSGSGIVLLVEGTGERTAESYDGESQNAPLLVVTYVTN